MRWMIALCLLATACSGQQATDADPTTTTAPPGTTTTSGVDPTTTLAPAASTTIPSETTTTAGASMEISSPAFTHEAAIPERYSCHGTNVSPELNFSGIPDGTASLVLTMDDPDAPGGTWDHWVVFDMDVTDGIPEATEPTGTPGLNSWKLTGYGGPCPPSGTHRYVFALYALDAELGLPEGATKAEVTDAMEGHILADATLIGLFTAP